MIRVRIEMCPHGDQRPDAVREIGRMYIANVGGDHERGDYQVAVCRRNTNDVPAPINPKGAKAVRAGSVTNYPRLSYNVWRLIARACLSTFPEERAATRKPAGTDRGEPVLDEEVMKGLELIGAHLEDGGHVWLEGTEMDDVESALKWLHAGNLDGDK